MTSKKRIASKIALKIILWSLFVVTFMAARVGFFEFKYSGLYYPGVMIAGQSVGGKTYAEVLQEFTEKSDTLLNNGLVLVFERQDGKTEVNIPAITTGLTSDTLVEYFSIIELRETVTHAYNWGRQGTMLQRLKEQFVLLSGKNFNSPAVPHQEAIKSLLARETKNIFTPKVPARFSFDKSGVLTIIPEKLGDSLDMDMASDLIIQKFNEFQVQPVTLKIQLEPPYTTEEKLKPFISLAEKISKSANINFYYHNHKWRVSGKTLTTWLTLKSNNEVTVDDKKLEAFLAKSVAPFINDPPQNSRFEMKSGILVEISPGKSGNVVNISKTMQLIEKIIAHMQQSLAVKGRFTAALIAAEPDVIFKPESNLVDVPIVTAKVEPQITQKTIDQYNITDLIGYARTNFAGGSKDRQNNIEVGVSKLTGILIAPGEEFSAVKNIGEVSEKEGFLKEYVIKENQTVKELGGGLCQLATTLFRTALNAGLPITERINHRYVIPYYGPGLDATIYGPHPDFRFINDTGNYILLQGAAKNNEVIFELYGVADKRVVEISAPVLSDEKPVPETRYIMSHDLPPGEMKCTTITHKGVTADTTYTVGYPDGFIKETVFHSVYEAWPVVCVTGLP